MSAGDIIRRVIIQTEIQPVQGSGSGASRRQAGDAGGSRPLGGNVAGGATRGGPRAGVTGETPEQRTARLHGQAQDALLKKAHRETMGNIKAQIDQTAVQRRMEDQQHKATMRMLQQRFDAEVKGHKAMARSLNAELQKTQFGRGGGGSQFRSGPGVNRGGQGANYFSTGNAMLDRANQIGFQMFITSMSAMMVAQFGKMALEGLAGLGGEGEGFAAQLTRGLSGSARSRRDSVFTTSQDLVGGAMRGVGLGDFAEATGYGRRTGALIERGTGLRGEIMGMAQDRMTSAMRAEDELIEKKREMIREEIDATQARMVMLRGEKEAAMGRREAIIQQVGRLPRAQQDELLELSDKLKAGVGPEDLTRRQRGLVDQNRLIFGEQASAFGANAFFAGDGNRLLDNVNANRPAFALGRQEMQLRNEIIDMKMDPVFDIKLNIERLELESKNMADAVSDQLVPLFDDMFDQVSQEIIEFVREAMEDERRKKRVGGEGGGVLAPFKPIFGRAGRAAGN